MNEAKKYCEKIAEISPATLFQYWYYEKTEFKPTKHRTYLDSNKFTFISKDRYLRTTIMTKNSDELRFDFDNLNLENNLKEVRILIEKLHSLEVLNFEIFLSGGKGIHLQLRYSISEFIECGEFSREQIRRAIFEFLDVKINIDTSLFRTQQMLGCEGYKHRKTGNKKQRISVDYDSYSILKDELNYNYLEDSYINYFDTKQVETIISILNNKSILKRDLKEFKEIKINNNSNFNQKKLDWEIRRFEEIFSEIKDGKKRVFDCLTRLLISRTKNYELTKKCLIYFQNKYSIECNNLDYRINSSKLAYEKYHALFPYDFLRKEYFYKDYNL